MSLKVSKSRRVTVSIRCEMSGTAAAISLNRIGEVLSLSVKRIRICHLPIMRLRTLRIGQPGNSGSRTCSCNIFQSSFYNYTSPRLARLFFGIIAIHVAEQHKTTRRITLWHRPLLHFFAAVIVIESLLGAGDYARRNALFGGGKHHVFGATKRIRNAVQKIFLRKDHHNRRRTVKTALDCRVVDDGGLLRRHVSAKELFAMHTRNIQSSKAFHLVAIVHGNEHAPLSAASVGRVKPRIENVLQIVIRNLPRRVFAYRAAVLNQ